MKVNPKDLFKATKRTKLKRLDRQERKERREKEENADQTHLMIQFYTKQKQYSVPNTVISVKRKSEADDLNKIVASLWEYSSGDDAVDKLPKFSFIIDDRLLTSNLQRHFFGTDHNYEQTTSIEYFKSLPPPTPQDNLQHDDWVSAVANSPQWLLSGSYDHTIQLWKSDSSETTLGRKLHKLTIRAHKAPVKAVAWLQPVGDVKTFVSTSIDQRAMVWQWEPKPNTAKCIIQCRGHSESVECIAVKDARTFVSGAWDCTIKMWNTDSQDGDEIIEPDEKKVKSGNSAVKKAPLMTLCGHSEKISGLSWMEGNLFCSSSWDHTIRVWDVEAASKTSQITSNTAFHALSYSPLNKTIVASSVDRYVRMYDPRALGGSIAKSKFENHNKWIPSLQWSSTNENLFATACYDAIIRVYDRRGTKASVYNLTGHKDKVFSLDWSDPSQIATGSADSTVKIFSVRI